MCSWCCCCSHGCWSFCWIQLWFRWDKSTAAGAPHQHRPRRRRVRGRQRCCHHSRHSPMQSTQRHRLRHTQQPWLQQQHQRQRDKTENPSSEYHRSGRSLLHLAVLEALYIRKLDPELCVQKENVLSLQLFGTVRREGAK